ncbi:Hint domain-containing protein [Phyllobacterium sp. BT25]|uniref:Hint domain-containing protein n=1 Tax=Phyllobacterium pellucidum TaxID=2740464 RepID=A0A849VNS1_9HYPH|nr:Hint domain-containing protein [Phyllobacterium pellucidum]NTS30684.1 Hint domain-containing protein [Phyllobacterium pellucidum]
MTSNTKPNRPSSRARRHFLGVVAAASAAVTVASLPALAKDKPPKDKPPKGGDRNCFLRGTSIMTPTGEVRIEDIRIGDLVETVRGKAMAVKWIGHQRYKKSGPCWPDNVMPIRIARQALDERTPHKDLYLSPNHALFIDGVLIRVKELVNGISIAPADFAETSQLDYYNIMLDTHEVILAEGTPIETFLLRGSNHESFTNFAEYNRLYRAETFVTMAPFAPIVGYEGGREHLKALLCLGVSSFVPMRDPVQEASERIAARAEGLVA